MTPPKSWSEQLAAQDESVLGGDTGQARKTRQPGAESSDEPGAAPAPQPTERRHWSLAQVRASYPLHKAYNELTGDLPVYLFWRPLSFPTAYLLLLARVPPMAVTLVGALLGPAMLAMAMNGGAHAYAWVALLGVLFELFDCTDGNIARTTGRTSHLGAMLDGFIDSMFWPCLLTALGFLARHEASTPWSNLGPELGMAAAILQLVNRQARDHFALRFQHSAVLGRAPKPRLSVREALLSAGSGLEHLYVFAIGIGGYFAKLGAVLAGAVIYTILISTGAVLIVLYKATRLDRLPTLLEAEPEQCAQASVDAPQEQASVLPTERE